MAKQGEATLLLKIKTLGEESLKSIQESFDTLKYAGLAAWGAIGVAVYKGIAEFKESEEVTNALTQSMVNNGIYSKALRDDYLDQAKALQAVTQFSDEQVIQAQTAVQQQIGQHKVTKDLTMAILDFATAQKMDVASAAEVAGKSIGTATNALARYGIQVTAGASSTQKMAEVVKGLEGKFGGQAQAATDGLGALKQLHNTVNDLFEIFGGKLAPIIGLVTRYLNDMAADTEKATPIMDGLITVFKATAMVAIELEKTIEAIGAAIGIGLAASVEAASQALEGNFAQAVETVKTGYAAIEEAGLKAEAEADAAMTAIAGADSDRKAQELAKDEENLRKSLENQAAIKLQKTAEQQALELEQAQIKVDTQAIEMDLLKATEEQKGMAKIDAQIKTQELLLTHAKTHNAKMSAENEIYRLNELKKQAIMDEMKKQNQKDTFSTIAGLSQSNNSTLAGIGKAAAITQIAIDTPLAIGKSLAAFPYPFNFVAAGLVGAAMAEQAARVAGIPLAEGGIVTARPGGIQATIGEGGRDEAVIPLENGQIPGSNQGSNIHITVYGGMLGDERTAQEFAGAVDKELLKLRQNGGSVAFDRNI